MKIWMQTRGQSILRTPSRNHSNLMSKHHCTLLRVSDQRWGGRLSDWMLSGASLPWIGTKCYKASFQRVSRTNRHSQLLPCNFHSLTTQTRKPSFVLTRRRRPNLKLFATNSTKSKQSYSQSISSMSWWPKRTIHSKIGWHSSSSSWKKPRCVRSDVKTQSPSKSSYRSRPRRLKCIRRRQLTRGCRTRSWGRRWRN